METPSTAVKITEKTGIEYEKPWDTRPAAVYTRDSRPTAVYTRNSRPAVLYTLPILEDKCIFLFSISESPI